MQTFGIYIIGDEILSGKRQDGHLSRAIEILSARGLALSWAQYLSDDLEQITAAFETSFAKNNSSNKNIVFSFGGIGATPDDYTRQCAAAALNVPIERHVGAVAEIVAQFGESAYPKRVLMADFPQGAGLIPNPVNRVAGFSAGTGISTGQENKTQPNQKHSHYFLPGFPAMAHPMMEWVLDTHYSHLFHQNQYLEQSIIVVDGIESQLIDLMNETLQLFPEIKIFSLPKLKPIKQVELGAKGAPEQVKLAMIALKIGVEKVGFTWTEA